MELSQNQFEQLLGRLDTLIKISVINAFQGKSRAEVITVLSDLGFDYKNIAAILGTTPSYVAKVKSEVKKQRDEKANAKKAEKAPADE